MEENWSKKLIEYFREREDVVMAFAFGSRAQNRSRTASDWDIGVYFAPPDGSRIEYENTNRDYPQEREVTADLVRILQADNIDLIVLNRAPASIADAAIRGVPLVVKDRRVLLEFMLRVTALAEEYRRFVKEYYEIAERSKSLSEEDAAILRRNIRFIEEQMSLYEIYRKFSQGEFENDPRKRNEIERWLENIVNALIDISKILVSSKKRPIPQTYRETVSQATRDAELSPDIATKFDEWVGLRNTLAHEYLDVKWRRISEFAATSEPHVRQFIDAVKRML